ncbi:rhodanese-like domain-containing protein [Rickettsiales bacterium]|nr:rhodanese-like domain-containing protein [Rickettsiales bacterium]
MKTITKKEIKQMHDKKHEDFVLINVLSQEYFNKKHIETSINIPHDQGNFEETVEKTVGSKKRKVVVYCAGSKCDASIKAAKKLEKAGFANVYAYEGGVEDWFTGDHSKAA